MRPSLRLVAVAVAVLIALLAVPAAAGAAGICTHTGAVIDKNGKPIAGADVIAHRYSRYTGNWEPDCTTVTDVNGAFSLMVGTYSYGYTYYYVTYEHHKYATVQMPAWDGSGVFWWDGTYHYRTDWECQPDPVTIVLEKKRL